MSIEEKEKEQVVLSANDLKSELAGSDKLDAAISNISPPVNAQQAEQLKTAVVDAASQSVRSSGTRLDQAVQRDQ